MKNCKYCGKEFDNGRQVAGHQNSCKKNPNRKKFLNNLSERKKHEKKKYQFECETCGFEYKLELTENNFKKGKYRKNCSLKCANSRKHSENTKNKISNSLIKHKNRICLYDNCDSEITYRNKSGYCKKHFRESKFYKERQKLGIQNTKKEIGGYRTKSGRSKIHGGYYKNVWMDSSWEIEFAKRLDQLNIIWKRKGINTLKYIDIK